MKALIVVDPKRCVGCHSCELACAVAHSRHRQLYGAVAEDPPPQSRVYVERYQKTNLPLQCRHCEDAPCVNICPTSAMQKGAWGEAVLIDKGRCIGCKWCLLVCPFGAITLGPEEKAMVKCDLCAERAAEGRPPACTEACLTGALQYTPVEEFTRTKRREFVVDFLQSS